MNYKHMTIGDLLDFLRSVHDETRIHGLRAITGSYRGYYEDVAIEPGEGCTAGELRREVEGRLGTVMYGYKGGEFPYTSNCLVFVADYGDTGSMLCGFFGTEPILVEESW